MKQKLINYIEKNLALAIEAPNSQTAMTWYNQAFGALSFYSYTHYESHPEDEAEMVKRWNDEWRIKFDEAVYSKIKNRG